MMPLKEIVSLDLMLKYNLSNVPKIHVQGLNVVFYLYYMNVMLAIHLL